MSERMVVVGAGAFGGWTALHLLRRGARVALLDAWGPGNARASSGGDTRVIRHTYGARIYVDMAARALVLWREHARRWELPLHNRTGVLWMAGEDDALEVTALGHLRAAGVPHEVLSPAELARRFPQIDPDGVRWAVFEPDGGHLLARRSCEAVVDAFVAEGGEYRQVAAEPGPYTAARWARCTWPAATPWRPAATSSPAARGWAGCSPGSWVG